MRGKMDDKNMEMLREKLPLKFYEKIMDSLVFILDNVSQAEQIYLFGSCARLEPRWDSDIDIAIITEETLTDHYLRGYVSCVLDEYSEKGVRADVIFRTPQMSDISPTFKRIFEKDKVLLWERGC